LAYISVLLFPNSYTILFLEFFFLPFSVHVQTNVIYLTLRITMELSNLAYSHIPNPLKIIFVASEINRAEGPTDMNIDHAFILSPFLQIAHSNCCMTKCNYCDKGHLIKNIFIYKRIQAKKRICVHAAQYI
jgi:hypothetical protein